jgi:isopentenyl diphosphate isomerase/L-lactate dehydrogenase-like FMN-dependent dehydrogenase
MPRLTEGEEDAEISVPNLHVLLASHTEDRVMTERRSLIARREFLRFVAASPYVAAAGGLGVFLRLPGASAQSGGAQLTASAELIADAAAAINVFDFEEVAHRKVSQAHWAYMASGVDDDATLRANREVFKRVQLRPRRLHDATLVDTRVDLFGTTYSSPIFLCPTGGERSFFTDGELAVARAAKAHGTLQCLSTMTSTAIEDVNKALGRPVWYQLYAPSKWEACEQLLRRVEAAGSSVVLLTVDNTTGRNSETYRRGRPKDLSGCVSCHGPGEPPGPVGDRAMFKGIDMTGVRAPSPAMDWAFVDRLRKFWRGKLVIKGIDTHEDARMAIEHGFDAILVSNHGGRATETLRSTLEALPEVVSEAGTRVPVFVDGGFRRGTDVFKALALGAKAVGVGRPFLWGLGAFGQAGVDRVIDILQGELKLVMGNCGTRTVADINRAYVATDLSAFRAP